MTHPGTPTPNSPAPAQLTVTPQDRILNTGGTPTPAAVVPVPASGPKPSAVEQATEAARQRLEAGQSLLPTNTRHDARNPGNGQFTEAARLDQAREAGSPRAGQGTQTAQTPSADTQTAPDPQTTADGQGEAETPEETEEQRTAREAAEAARETPEQRAAREAIEARSVVLTDNRGQEIEIELPEGTPQEVIDTVRMYRNGFMRAEEVRMAEQQITERANQLADRQAEIELDPVGFVLDLARDMPEIELQDGTSVQIVDHLVLHLLSQPKIWDRLSPKVQALLEDEKELRTVRAETGQQRHAIREEMRTVAEERAVVSRNLQDVQATLGAILPASMPQAQQRLLYDDCLRDLKEYADRHRLLTLPIQDIPAILATRLTAYGVNPAEAATRATESAQRRASATRSGRQSATRPASPSRAPAPPARSAAPPAPRNGQRFVASARQRQVLAGLPAAGAGSPSGTPALTPPNNPDGTKMTIEQRVEWHRGQLRKGIKRY